jgi:hypothetical protein
MRIQQQIGTTIAEWNDEEPLRWTLKEEVRRAKERQEQELPCELVSLRGAYSESFLLALKDAISQRRHKATLATIDTFLKAIRNLLRICREQKVANGIVQRIDHDFLVGLSLKLEKVPIGYLERFRTLYRDHRANGALFDRELSMGDFPRRVDKRGQSGSRKNNVLSLALNRAAMVHILNATEEAFEEGTLDLARYSFIRLALHLFGRPASYRELRCKDLQIDKDPATGKLTYFVNMPLPKARTRTRPRVNIKLHQAVGELLQKQREAVTRDYLDLKSNAETAEHKSAVPVAVDKKVAGNFALFPASRLWVVEKNMAKSGMLRTSTSFRATYLTPIQELTGQKLSFVALRHTIGTQLALMGCSASTISGVLRHATDEVARVYVDIVFEGLIDEISDALAPAFAAHYPVFSDFRSKKDDIPPERRIVSEDRETGRTELTAECGRLVACDFAPLACYECPRFKPCYDADHSINLDVVDREINFAERGGLPMKNEARRYKHIRNCIRLVISAAEAKQASMQAQQANPGPKQ